MAHIIAATTGGARDVAKKDMSECDRASHSNIAVLCANCHTFVDKDPNSYPTELMHAWKARHQQALEQALSTPNFKDRSSARAYIESRLADNRAVFLTYGAVEDDFSEERAHQRSQLAVKRLVPNNAEVTRALRKNRHLFTPDDLEHTKEEMSELQFVVVIKRPMANAAYSHADDLGVIVGSVRPYTRHCVIATMSEPTSRRTTSSSTRDSQENAMSPTSGESATTHTRLSVETTCGPLSSSH